MVWKNSISHNEYLTSFLQSKLVIRSSRIQHCGITHVYETPGISVTFNKDIKEVIKKNEIKLLIKKVYWIK